MRRLHVSQKPPPDQQSTQPAAPNSTHDETQSSLSIALDPQVHTQESPLAVSTLRVRSQEPSHTTGILKVHHQEPSSTPSGRRVSIQEPPPSLSVRRVSIQEPLSILQSHRISSHESYPDRSHRRFSIQDKPSITYNGWVGARDGQPNQHLSTSLTEIQSVSNYSQTDFENFQTVERTGQTFKQNRLSVDVPPSITHSPEASIKSIESIVWGSQESFKQYVHSPQLSQITLDNIHNYMPRYSTGIGSSRFQDKWSRQSLLPLGWRLLHEARKISRQLSLVLSLAGMVIIGLISLGQPWMHFQVPLKPPGDPDGPQTIPVNTIFFMQCPDVVCMYEYDQNASGLAAARARFAEWEKQVCLLAEGLPTIIPSWWLLQLSCCPAFPPAVAMAERVLAPTQMGRGDRYYTYTELLAISRRFKQNPNELMITWILRVYDQGGPALSLNSGELALLGDLTHDAIFNYHCKTLRGGCKTLLTWLLQAWRQRWESFLHFEATELPFRPWTTMEEGIQLVRELGMLDWIYRELPSPLSPPEPEYAAPEDVPFTQGLQRRLLTAAPSELRLSLVSLLVKGMTVLEAVMEIQTIADVGLLWRQSQPGRAKLMLGPNPTRKDLTGWLLSHGVPRERVDKQPTKVLLELYIKEAKRSRSQPVYGLGEEQPPPPPYSDQACGEEPPIRHD
ncbi:uncharacterized protein GHT09_014667 [Marmota monax]|nr:uncharacterized protein GHT09_014667 [Marmota monax]